MNLEPQHSDDRVGSNQYAWSPCSSIVDNQDFSQGAVGEFVVHHAHKHSSETSRHSSCLSTSLESYATTQRVLELSSHGYIDCDHNHRPYVLPLISHGRNETDTMRQQAQQHDSGACHSSSTKESCGRYEVVHSPTVMTAAEMTDYPGDLVEEHFHVPSMSDGASLAEQSHSSNDELVLRPDMHARADFDHVGQRLSMIGRSFKAEGVASPELQSADRASVCLNMDDRSSDYIHLRQVRQVRPKTPPGLFGRLTSQIVACKTIKDNTSHTDPIPILRSNSRLARAAAAVGIKDNGRLGRALAGQGEPDWITVTDGDTQHGPSTDDSIPKAQPVDPRKCTYPGPSEAERERQDPKVLHGSLRHPRYNFSWSLMRNTKAGTLALVPGHTRTTTPLDFDAGTNSHSHNAPVQAAQCYVHPRPLSRGYAHPHNSSPRITPTEIKVDIGDPAGDSRSDKASSGRPSKNSRIGQFHYNYSGLISRDVSSTWLSTVSESQNTESTNPQRISSFGKITLLQRNGRLSNTGSKEVGSSLADESSPQVFDALPESTPPRLITRESVSAPSSGDYSAPSPQYSLSCYIAKEQKLSGLGNSNTVNEDTEDTSSSSSFDLTNPANIDVLAAGSPSHEAQKRKLKSMDIAKYDIEANEIGPRQQSLDGKSPDSERQIASAWLKYSTVHACNGQFGAPAGGQDRDIHVSEDIEVFTSPRSAFGIRECDAECEVGEKSSSTSLPEPRKLRSSRQFQHVVQIPEGSRNIACIESPHMLRFPVLETVALETLRRRHSRFWAITCLFIPFLGPLFGHGCFDRYMQWYTDGKVQSYRRQEKLVILIYSYSFFGAVVIALVLALVFVARE